MSDSNAVLIKTIIHYQQCLEKYTKRNDEQRMVYCISKLAKLPITVEHLEHTGVGRTVNSLRKITGDPGDAAKALVAKWKEMVVGEDNEPNLSESKSRSDMEELKQNKKHKEKIKSSSSSHKDSDNKRNSYSNKPESAEKPIIKSSDHNRQPKLDKHEKNDGSYIKNKNEAKNRKLPKEISDDGKSESENEAEKYKSNNHKHKSSRGRAEREDSESEEENKNKHSYKRKSSKRKRETSEDEEDDHDKQKYEKVKAKIRKLSESEDSEQEIVEDNKKHKHSHKHKDNKKEKKDKYVSEHKNKDSHSSSSKSRSKQDKDEGNRKSHNSSSKSRHKEHKSSKKEGKGKAKCDANGIGSGSGTSFAEALGMLVPSSSKANNKKKVAIVNPYSFEKTSDDSSDNMKPSVSNLLVGKKLEPLDINISNLLPEITPNYRPLGNLPMDSLQKKNQIAAEEEALSAIMYSKITRTKVYSGNKVAWGKVPTLFDLCTHVLQDNIDALEYTGGVPFSILKPVIERANPDQLFLLEHHNPYLIEDTDDLWRLHCQREFRTKRREEMETWRDMYMRCLDEREAKLKILTANIKQSQDKSLPVRQTKLAYVDNHSYVKPPRSIARKQAKHGTGGSDKKPLVTPSSRLSTLAAAGTAGLTPVPNPGARASTTAGGSSGMVKVKKAPLMQKTLAFMKNRLFRR